MTTVKTKKFTITEYHRLAEIGFFREDERVELIRGEIIEMSPKGTAHSVCETRLERELYKLLGEKATLRGQQSIIIPNNSEPEPDRVIAKNSPDDYLSHHPEPDDILLVIEVADSTLNYDRTTKLTLYAEAGISNYWIFNLVANNLETYQETYQDEQGNYGYRMKRIYLANEGVILPNFPELSLNLAKVFPPVNN
ncbi:MAG: Uma2 family endonuclease [Kamptonema sp. SIO1D9]|nr:Uma2 family endonuclease [Kamptonema sp. SIO1D9]